MNLNQYLKLRVTKTNALCSVEAKLFGIPYPLRTGWVKRYANASIPDSEAHRLLDARKKGKQSLKSVARSIKPSGDNKKSVESKQRVCYKKHKSKANEEIIDTSQFMEIKVIGSYGEVQKAYQRIRIMENSEQDAPGVEKAYQRGKSDRLKYNKPTSPYNRPGMDLLHSWYMRGFNEVSVQKQPMNVPEYHELDFSQGI